MTAILATVFFITSLGLAYLNQNVEVAPSLLESNTVEEPVVSAPVEEQIAVEEEMNFDLPPLPEAEGAAEPAASADDLPVVPEESN